MLREIDSSRWPVNPDGNPDLAAQLKKERIEAWNKLSQNEKAICSMYAYRVKSGIAFGGMKELVIQVNKIHQKYPEFGMDCVP